MTHRAGIYVCLLVTVSGGVSACGDTPGGQNVPLPEIVSTAPTIALEGVTYVYDATCVSEQSAALALAVGGNDTCGGTLTDRGDGTGSYTLSPTEDQGGTWCMVHLTCSNGLNAATQHTRVTILETNQAPLLLNLPEAVTGHFGRFNLFSAEAADPDRPRNILRWHLSGDTCSFTPQINDTTGQMRWVCQEVETCTVDVTVTDNGIPTGSATAPLTIECANSPPEIVSQAPDEAAVAVPYVHDVACQDLDGDPLRLAVGGGDTCGGTLLDHGDGTGTYTFVPDAGQVAAGCLLEVTCTDTQATDTQTVAVTVYLTNLPPVINNLPDTAAGHWDQAGSFDADATDPDGQPGDLTWSLMGHDCSFTPLLDPATGEIGWICQGVETCTLQVQVTDDGTPARTDAAALTVECTNTPPRFTSLAPPYGAEGVVYSYGITCADEDSDALTIARGAGDTCNGALTDNGNGTGTYVFTPGSGLVGGNCTVEVVCSDSQDAATQTTIVPVDRRPVADAGLDRSVAPGVSVVLDGSGSHDPDGDAIVQWEWTPVGGSPPLDDADTAHPRLVSGGCGATHRYTLRVSDGRHFSDPDEVVLTVHDVGTHVWNDPARCGNAGYIACGDRATPWCTIQQGADTAIAIGHPTVYVAVGSYLQGASLRGGAEVEDLTVTGPSQVDIQGGYASDFSTRHQAVSCTDPSRPTSIIDVSRDTGFLFESAVTGSLDGFCVRSDLTGSHARKANITVAGARMTLHNLEVDASYPYVAGGPQVDHTAGVFVGPGGGAGLPAECAITGSRIHGGTGLDRSSAVRAEDASALTVSDSRLLGGDGGDVAAGVDVLRVQAVLVSDAEITGSATPPAAVTWEPQLATAAYIDRSNAEVTDSTLIGGSTWSKAVGVYVPAVGDPGDFLIRLQDNLLIAGHPDLGSHLSQHPALAVGVYHPPSSGSAVHAYRFWFVGTASFNGGVGRPVIMGGQACHQGIAYGVYLENALQVDIAHHRILGGIVHQGAFAWIAALGLAVGPSGLVIIDPAEDSVIEANLVESCGIYRDSVTLARSYLSGDEHDPLCEVFFEATHGLLARNDQVGTDTPGALAVFNNLLYGGYSKTRSVAAGLVLGNGPPGVTLYNNHLNAQGWVAGSAPYCGGGAVDPPAMALWLFVPPPASVGYPVLTVVNNILDHGGRACERYGIYEATDAANPADLISGVIKNNTFVDEITGRDLFEPSTGPPWSLPQKVVLQHESRLDSPTMIYEQCALILNGQVGCTATVDQCLDTGPPPVGCDPSPTAISNYDQNLRGDPVFLDAGRASEVPGVLLLASPPRGLETFGNPVTDNGDASLNPGSGPTHDFKRTARPQGTGLDRGHNEQ